MNNKDKRIWTAVGGAGIAVLLACGNPTGLTVPTSTGGTVAPEVTVEGGQAETVAQKNARLKATSYLNTSAFSHPGLIKQLAFEGFAEQDAAYGVNSLSIDWMVQAEKKAKSYMNTSSFSRKGLIDQLKFEGFTQAEAEHGATFVGL